MAIAVFTGTNGAEVPWPRPALTLLEPLEDVVEEPLVLPIRTRRRASAAVRRRRWAVVLVAGALVALAMPLRALGASPAAPSSSPAMSALPTVQSAGQGSYYVVRPGDTLSSIARRLDPARPGEALAALKSELGSPIVVPGEHIHLP
jgi:hypothetical protein